MYDGYGNQWTEPWTSISPLLLGINFVEQIHVLYEIRDTYTKQSFGAFDWIFGLSFFINVMITYLLEHIQRKKYPCYHVVYFAPKMNNSFVQVVATWHKLNMLYTGNTCLLDLSSTLYLRNNAFLYRNSRRAS